MEKKIATKVVTDIMLASYTLTVAGTTLTPQAAEAMADLLAMSSRTIMEDAGISVVEIVSEGMDMIRTVQAMKRNETGIVQ